MKKITMFVVAVFMSIACMSFFAGCDNGDYVTLKVHNWGDYMDPAVIKGFSDWYTAQTGEKIKVKYTTFDINETMYNDIEVKKADYDLVCPSEYMAQRMINNGLALEIDKSIVNVADRVRSDLLNITETYDEGSKFTVPYMWGTLGIMYDVTKVTEEERSKMDSWSALFDSDLRKNMLMKDSIRDAYVVANIYNNRELLSDLSNEFKDYNDAYKQELKKQFTDVEDATIAAVKDRLTAQKSLVYKYEVDDGKDIMMTGTNKDVKLGLFWSCDSGYVMNDVEMEAIGCCAGATLEGNKNLHYVVPKEGSNVWVDAWVMPKYAKNRTAANYFLKYLCEKDIAKKNSAYVGSSTPIEDAMNEFKQELLDGDFFTKPFKGKELRADFKDMYLDMMFPSPKTLERCAVMEDFGAKSAQISEMWVAVKAS